jgi:hypothetical protein
LRIPQSREDLMMSLGETVQFIIASCTAFDSGFESEAKRIAVAIRVLVQDTEHSKSLLAQLGKKDIPFYDTGHLYNPKNLLTHFGLLWIKAGGTASQYVPLLEEVFKLNRSLPTVRKVPFDTWWNRIVIVDSNRDQFTRRNLILGSANSDGGAHVDPTLDSRYANITRFDSHGWHHVRGGKEIDFANRPVMPSIRHIAFEVVHTLQDAFPI